MTNPAILATLQPYAPHAQPHPAGAWQRWLEAWREPALCECGGALVRRKGRRGAFLGCNHYPDCNYTRDAPPPDTLPVTVAASRYLNKAEKAQASQDGKDKRAKKRAAKAKKAAKGKKLQPEMVIQLPVEGFDYREWFGEDYRG